MPKQLKKKRIPPSDVNQWARQLVEQSTAEPETEAPPPAIAPAALSAYMAALGRKGGRVSGAKRMEMPARKRMVIAKKAAQARWTKKRPVQS